MRTVLSAGQLWFSRMAGRRSRRWDIYSSLDLMTARAFIGPAAQDMNLVYGPQGIVEIRFGQELLIHPDGVGR